MERHAAGRTGTLCGTKATHKYRSSLQRAVRHEEDFTLSLSRSLFAFQKSKKSLSLSLKCVVNFFSIKAPKHIRTHQRQHSPMFKLFREPQHESLKYTSRLILLVEQTTSRVHTHTQQISTLNSFPCPVSCFSSVMGCPEPFGPQV